MPGSHRQSAFTLIEILVVVAIIAMLIAILLPSLASARAQSRLVVCQSNLHQLGLGITAYHHDQHVIPFGPAVDMTFLPPNDPSAPPQVFEGNDNKLATNQIWTGPQSLTSAGSAKPQRMALGLLLARSFMFPAMMYCPDDDSSDPVEELEKVKRRSATAVAYSSFLYRQLQETNGKGRLEDLGFNSAVPYKGRATALAMDMNSLLYSFGDDGVRTNHKAAKVNVLYRDASVRSCDNAKHAFSLRDQDLVSGPDMVFADLASRRAVMFQEADRKY